MGIINRAATMDADLTSDDIKKVLIHLGLRERAMTLLMASGDLRAGEIFNLRIGDINLKTRPSEVTIYGAKDGSDR